MEHFTVDSATFARFRQRFENWLADDMPGVDPKLASVMPLFTNMRKVVPTFSCSAHPRGIGKEKPTQHTYFALVVEEGGYDELAEFFRIVEAKVAAVCNELAYVQTSLVLRTRPFRWDHSSKEFHYYSHTLTFWPVKSEEMQDNVLAMVKESLASLSIPADRLAVLQEAIRDLEEMTQTKAPSNYRSYLEKHNYHPDIVGNIMEVQTPSLVRLMVLNRFLEHGDIPGQFYPMYKKKIIDMYKLIA